MIHVYEQRLSQNQSVYTLHCISGILIGNSLCFQDPEFSGILFVLMLFTAISFQIISNFANDYGDGVKGTDNDNRLGPKRVLQQGLLSNFTNISKV